ncbi:MAG: translation factor [Cyanobium sp. CACIAM 14]|nr:MAG: translation factor [Cyanobium sp. CACIAM 14]
MSSFAELAQRLAAGEAVLFPTDTLPALAARPEAADRLWQIKARPADKPLILMGSDLLQLIDALGVPWQEPWLEKARRCWPGAVTLVLPIDGPLTALLHPGGSSLGLRVPACPLAQDLLARTGTLATTSANRSGQPPATTAAEAAAQFPSLALLDPLPWPQGSGRASTVLAWRGNREGAEESWQVLRAGIREDPAAGGA